MEFTFACLESSFGRLGSHRHLTRPQCTRAILMIAALSAVLCSRSVWAEEPLHVRIDQCMAEIHPGPEIPLCSDGEFLKRIYLDLVGKIPTGQQARAFLADTSAEKRSKVVERLLSSPDHAAHMAKVFDVMLMERRADKYVKKEAWDSYLLTSFQQDKPLNQLAREVLAADGVDENKRGPAKFYLEREVEPNLLTREVGRMFFGMDLQCAQCHDHPLIDDYYQSDFYGLFAFVGRSYLFQPDKKKPAVLAEKAEGDAKFKSVFTEEEGSTLPCLPGSVEIDEPSFAKDDAYQVKPDPKKKDVRPIPKHSRRQELARRATDGSNRAFNRNLANRVWAHMMGRGLVHPVDQHHSDNPPIQPQLLELLADELPKTNFDLKSMLRQLALSRTYQRSVDFPIDFAQHADAAGQQLELWQQRLIQLKQASQKSVQTVGDLEGQLQEQEAKLAVLVEAEKKTNESLAASKKTADDATKAMNDGTQTLAKHQNVLNLLSQSASKATEAAGVFGDDKLSNALKMLNDRRQYFEAKVAEQTKQLVALTMSQQVAATKLSETQEVAEEAKNKLKTAQDARAAIAKTLAESKEQLRLGETAVSHAGKQISRLKTAVAFAETVQQSDALQGEKKRLADQIADSQATFANLTSDVKRLAEEMQTAVSAHASAASATMTAKQQLASSRGAADLLAASLAKANEAAQIFTADAELKNAIDKLDTSSRELLTKVASLDNLVAETGAAEVELATKVQSLREMMNKANNDLAAAQTQLDALRKQQTDKSQQLDQLAEELQTRRDTLTAAWSKQFSIAVVQPLSPEQLAWSILHTTGYVDRQRSSVQAALDKKSPLKPEEKQDTEKLAAREQEVEKQTQAKLKGIIDRFVKLFAAASGQPQDDFFATVDQALFFRNGGELQSWLAPSGGNLTDRLQNIEDAKTLAEELYLSILTRFPTAQETADVAEYLSLPEVNKPKAVQDMAWALLTSAEFRFQH